MDKVSKEIIIILKELKEVNENFTLLDLTIKCMVYKDLNILDLLNKYGINKGIKVMTLIKEEEKIHKIIIDNYIITYNELNLKNLLIINI